MEYRVYKEGDRYGFCIFMFALKPKTGGWKPKTCNEFILYMVTRFKQVYGFMPNTVAVPDDYTGLEVHKYVTITRTAKPVGHYYAYVTEETGRDSGDVA